MNKNQKSKKKKRPIIIILDILIIACLLGAAYFFLEPKVRSHKQTKVEQSAVTEVEKLFDTEEEELSEISIAVNPNANKVPGEGYEDFGQGENLIIEDPILDENGNVIINFIGSLKIPKIDLVTPIADDDSLVALRYGAGHTPESAFFGENGRAIIFGHWFDEYGRVFNRLGEMKVGDDFAISITKNRTRYHYHVHKMVEIKDYELYDYLFVDEPEVESEVVLVSCKVENRMWWSTSDRYIVYGELIETEYIAPRKIDLDQNKTE